MTSVFPYDVPPGINEVIDWLMTHQFSLVSQSGKSLMASEAVFRNPDGLGVRLFADRGYWECHVLFPSGFWTHAVTASLLSHDERVDRAWDAYSPRASKASGYLDDLRQAVLWIYGVPDAEAQLRDEHSRQRALSGEPTPAVPATPVSATPAPPPPPPPDGSNGAVPPLGEPAPTNGSAPAHGGRTGFLGRLRRAGR